MLRIILLFMCLPVYGLTAEVTVYSARKEALIKPLLDQFSAKTGIKVNLLTSKADALIKRIEVEGEHTPADLLITVDVARLYRAYQKDILQPIQSEVLMQAVPANYRDPEHTWFGLSLRARVIVYAKDRVEPSALNTYMGLADEKWRGRLCVRSSSNVYNQSLVASLISHYGVDDTLAWATNLKQNFARKPTGGDRDQVRAVVAGVCDIALVNTYYLAGMLQSQEKNSATQVALFWPNQDTYGSHVNISGAGVAKHAKNIKEAILLLEFMVSDEAQRWYAQKNYEYPINPKINNDQLLKQWGDFKKDTINLIELGKYNRQAVLLMDRAGWQ